MPERCFLKVTNKDIYDKIMEMDKKLEDSLIRHTENKIKIGRLTWAFGICITLIIFILGIIINKGV
jgi:hypothetical protein